MQKNIFTCFVCLFMFLPLMTYGQASLDPTHKIDDITITDDKGKTEEITVIRDFQNPMKWYYVPNKPRLVEYVENNKPYPKFIMMMYQTKDGFETNEGGVLQFSVNLEISNKSIEQVKSQLVGRRLASATKNLSVAPLQITSATAKVYGDDGKMFAEGAQTPGIAPTFANSAMPVQINLSRLGAEVYETLVNQENGGVGILYTFSFEGCLPPAGFKTTINWDSSFKYADENKEIKIALESFVCGINVDIAKKKIRSELVDNKKIKIESKTGEAVSEEEINKYLDPIIKKFTDEMFEAVEPPAELQNAPAGKSALDAITCWFPTLKTEFISKKRDISKRKTGEETFEFNKSVLITRKTSCGGFIGIGNYKDKEVKDSLITVMKPGSWAKAFVVLPSVGIVPGLKISSINLTATMVTSSDVPVPNNPPKTATWTSKKPNVWIDKDNKPTSCLSFPIAEIFGKCSDDTDEVNKQYKIRIKVDISQMVGSTNNTISTTYFTPVFNGAMPLSTPMDLVECLIIDGSMLSFVAKGEKTGLTKVTVKVTPKLNPKVFTTDLSLTNQVFSMLVEAEREKISNPVTATIKFVTKEVPGGIFWKGSSTGVDFREACPDLSLTLYDEDYKN
ncbi:MAG: hypothetical protein HQM10_11800 [Candidatus Riflebacteria bacterium]|nr:hypothetical protein [Candidatus Riflebacteria bacterium]